TPEYAREAEEWTRQRIEAFAGDYAGAMRMMVSMLFHPDADAAIKAEVERRMLRTPQHVTLAMFEAIGGYDPNVAARRLDVPLRAITGVLFPTDVATIRKVRPDFDAIVMEHMGHYPMLERPEEFNRHVRAVVRELEK
ncbi:MAG TPA: alpha/beta hydrolase, partial [Thermoanaerobaculia bacterium]